MINSNIISLAKTELNSASFTGYIDIELNDTEITVLHEDGASWTTNISVEHPPQIISANFINGYPGVQTELKLNDTFDFNVITDIDIVRIEFADYGAITAQSFTVTGIDNDITLTIANRGNSVQNLGVKLRVQKSSGSYSDWYLTEDDGSVDGFNLIKCNNISPSITINSITYPTGQSALKDSETAILNNTITNYNTILYSSLNGELSISNNTTYKANKTVQRLSGSYNVTSNNITITCNRTANNSNSSLSGIVFIANVVPLISITEQYSRLRSSITGSNYNIILSSNQRLYEAPTLLISHGAWFNSFVGSSNNTVWTRAITISDSDTKGVYNYSSMSSKNLAGKITTIITGNDTYEIGGFVTRRIIFPAFQRLMPIGTYVVNTAKLQAIDIGAYSFTYQADKTNNIRTYTITDSLGNLNPLGNYIFVTDNNWVEQNSEGTAYIDLQEIV
jgi:hypothetical protein